MNRMVNQAMRMLVVARFGVDHVEWPSRAA